MVTVVVAFFVDVTSESTTEKSTKICPVETIVELYHENIRLDMDTEHMLYFDPVE